ncbi:MAG: exodeoxyribonuclease VII small subunit [Firmicutes bacterium]|nr:exodeoxyribonuclease VII small subunit [Bacillota bacterium]
MEEKRDFEKWEERLNQICEKMEDENLSISETEKLYEEGAELVLKCMNELDKVKGNIVKIEQQLDGTITEKKIR